MMKKCILSLMIMLLMCGCSGHSGSVDLSGISLGMTASEVRQILNISGSDDPGTYYVCDEHIAGSDNFSGSKIYMYRFTYGDGDRLDSISVIPAVSGDFSRQYDEFVSSVNRLYGLEADDWEWEGEYRAYAHVGEGDSTLQLGLKIYESEESKQVFLDIFNYDYRSFSDVPEIPVIP